MHVPVDIGGDDVPSFPGQKGGHPARSGPDFEYQISRSQFGFPDHEFDDVQIDQKVLAKLKLGPQTMLLEQPGQMRTGLSRGIGERQMDEL